MKKNIENKLNRAQLARVEAENTIASFYGLDAAGLALKASSFDVMEEVQTLIQHVRDPDPKVSLPALRHFRALLREITTANGMIGQVQQTQLTEDGDGSVRRTMSTSTLLTNLRNQNEAEDQDTEGFEEEPQTRHEVFLPSSRPPGGNTTPTPDLPTGSEAAPEHGANDAPPRSTPPDT